jgi:hypothetical protein
MSNRWDYTWGDMQWQYSSSTTIDYVQQYTQQLQSEMQNYWQQQLVKFQTDKRTKLLEKIKFL